MADFIVQEEDGTSRIELEEGTGFLVREEAGGVERAASFSSSASLNVLATAENPTLSTWEAGFLTVPSGTGSQAITGLRKRPKALFFFGVNFLTEDTAVTTTGTSIFRGMAGPKWDAPTTIIQNAACVSPAGDQHSEQDVAILVHTTAGTGANLYGATVTSIDANGFTLNWFTAAAGGYKVVWVALYDVANIGFFRGTGINTINLDWRAGASMLHGAWAGPVIGGADRTQEYYASGAYPLSGVMYGAGLTAFTFPTSAGQQYNIGVFNLQPDITITQGGTFVGPFLSVGNVQAYPTGTGFEDFYVDFTAADGGVVGMWDDYDTITGRLTPPASVAGSTTVTLPFEPGLVIGYSISNEPTQQGSGSVRGAVGFSVATPDFQWCALIDGFSSRGSYQSFQRGFVDRVDGTSVHAGEITFPLNEPEFVLTTDVASTSPSTWVWHAFGHPTPEFMWIPHFYRRVR